ncbi:MAG: TolC family protein [Planctomycetaceae bacterium]
MSPDTIESSDGADDRAAHRAAVARQRRRPAGGSPRIESVTIEPIDLTSEVALEIARANRLDWMNNRATLVDVWRLIEFNANQLKSNFTIQAVGDIQTVRNNPLSFDANASTMRAAIQFDPPFTRLVERNVFRQQLIQYQQSRRDLIQFKDAVNLTLRQLLRDMAQLRTNLEIQRRAVAIAIRRVDQTRESLNRPIPPAQPGQPATTLGPTVAQDLLFALGDLATAQNSMASVWIGYENDLMMLYRELGIMQLDDDGLWIRTPLEGMTRMTEAEDPLPPEVPPSWFQDPAPVEENVDADAQEPPLLPPSGNAARVPIRSLPRDAAGGVPSNATVPVSTEPGVRSPDDAAAARITVSDGDGDVRPTDGPPLERLGTGILRR